MTVPRFSHTAILLPNEQVLIAGGGSNADEIDSSALASAELYDPSTETFTAVGNMTTARVRHTATLLNDGKVLIAGGRVGCCNYASAELYDPSTQTFAATGELSAARQGHKATLLSSGKVLIEGGYTNTGGAAPELYDSATGTFSLTGSSAYTDLYASSASLLTSGKVLATLQYSCDESDKAELYDPSIGAFAATGNMTTGREYSTATVLPEGKVLISGEDPFIGSTSGGSAELYDPVSGTFSTAGDTQSGEGHTATLLNDGRVLIAGGWSFRSILPNGRFDTLSSAELYTPAVLAGPPVLLSLSGDGKGQGAIQHAGTDRIASASDPTMAGEALTIYGTGLLDGSVIPPQVAIGGRLAEIISFGNTPGYPGLNYLNIRMPSGVTPGPAVPVRLTYLSRPSNQVTVGVQ
jgi:hypothetical protein